MPTADAATFARLAVAHPDAIRQEYARRSFGAYSRRMFAGAYVDGAHIGELQRVLEAVERGEVTRLIVTMPPRHSKSQNVSEDFPSWYLGRNPGNRVIAVSHTASLAYTFSRRVRNKITDPRYPFAVGIAADNASVQQWSTDAGGAYLAVGVGGSPTGHGADLIVIDDPIRSAADADSETVREALWEWYQGTIRTRLQPGGAIIVTATRWHEDDLTGKLLAEMAAGTGEDWVHVHMPAISDDGAALWPAFWPLPELEKIRVAVGPRAWQAQFQGDPTPADGGMFPRKWWRRYRAVPHLVKAELYLDSAFKDGVGNDYSAMALWGHDGAGTLYLVKAWRVKATFPELIRWIHDCYGEAGELLKRARLPTAPALVIEDKASGQSAIQTVRQPYQTRDGVLPRLPVIAYNPPGNDSKQARADAVTGLAEGGRMAVPDTGYGGDWLEDWLAEHEKFPTGKHDDYVDTTAMAGARLGIAAMSSGGATAEVF